MATTAGAKKGLWSTIRRIAASDRISGLIMLGFALTGLVLANLPATAHAFETVAETHLFIPYTNLDLPIGHWAQDGLLTIFFLTVGLELKQELTTGSLANPKAAAVPMLCAVGGMITIDFKNPLEPVVEKLDYDFGAQDHSLIIVQTGKGHADLSAEYSSIPNEMKRVAAVFGKEVCAEITEQEVIENAAKVRKEAGDRAFLRALHFFEENKRVEKQVQALKENRFDEFLSLITESGNSSWKWLQNCYVPGSEEQGITSALALTELFIKEKGCGACRVHGGGFAGVIMAMLPNSVTDEYIAYIEKAMGEGSAYRMSIRPYGAVCVDGYIA